VTNDEKRIQQLIDNPERDTILESDIPLIRAGLLDLNWTDRPADQGGRVGPFITAGSQAAKYLQKYGRLNPANRRTLRGLADKAVRLSDIEWAKAHIQPSY